MKDAKLILGITLSFATVGIASFALANVNKTDNKSFVYADGETYSQGDVVGKNKARIWIGYDLDNPFYSYADETTGIRLWIHSTDIGGDELVYGSITGTFNNVSESNRRYDYFDVDLSVYTNSWYMTVQKFQGGTWKGQTDPIQLSSSNAMQVYYVWGDWAWDQTKGTVGPGLIDTVDAGLAAKALGGIHSCSSSNINGYGAFSRYQSTFVKKGDDWKTVGNLSDYTLNDFPNGDTSYSQSPTNTINAYDKYVYVEQLAGGASSNNFYIINTGNFQVGIIVGIICISGLVGVAIYLVTKKPKATK